MYLQAIDTISAKRSRVLWTLQEPVNTEKLHPARAMITNEQIDLYNKAAMEVTLPYLLTIHYYLTQHSMTSAAEKVMLVTQEVMMIKQCFSFCHCVSVSGTNPVSYPMSTDGSFSRDTSRHNTEHIPLSCAIVVWCIC